ncbi:MAG TPA: phosphoribosylglycinamide formyltransferase [Candidatus Saccharimonadales bacterium]|nr:phosphoribosylglycinamide formyltransferase [Candidatus Saccharimonadales bacterium]
MASKVKLGVLGSTNGTDLQAIIDAIERKGLDAEVVLVASDRAGAPILERARKHGIDTFSVDYKRFFSRGGAEAAIAIELRKRGAELILLIGFMKILTPYFVGQFRGRIWNIHPSLLPKYAGGMDLDIHEQVIRNRERESGCTLHEVVDTVDAGRIIMQKVCKVDDGETPETLKAKVQKLEQECLIDAITLVSEGDIVIG